MSPARYILLVDDDADVRLLLTRWLEADGHRVIAVADANSALEQVSRRRPALVITDLRMAGMDGIGLVTELQRRDALLPVVMLSGTDSVPDALRAMHLGLAAFLAKPVERAALQALVARTLPENNPGSGLGQALDGALVYRSAVMAELMEQAALVAAGAVTVLISGETGTGKEVLARAIHAAGPRADRPFIGVNCGAIPDQLLESELFGHERGAFTGALVRHEGLFRAADGGTLFLDEVGDMPLGLQVKLLRVLQDFQIRPVGAVKSAPVDVRIIAATHNDLPRAVERGSFREDLYYRLCVVPLELPPLRERPDDIPVLVDHFLARLAARSGGGLKRFAPEAERMLMEAGWPGNVRQLANTVEQCFTLSRPECISAALVKRALRGERAMVKTLKEARDEFELGYLDRVLRLARGNVAAAARMAGRNRTEFYKLLTYHGLEPQRFRDLRTEPGVAASLAEAAARAEDSTDD